MEEIKKLPIVYLDWNVFNKIKQLDNISDCDRVAYLFIERLILSSEVMSPYSNAHINDLSRGYLKNPSYTPGHLTNISRLTGNLCMMQFWGDKNVCWKFRNPEEVLRSVLDYKDDNPENYEELFDNVEFEGAKELFKIQLKVLELTPVPVAFKQIYAYDPIFSNMYPRTKVHMNNLALCQDLYSFSLKIKSDFTLYKSFTKFLNQTRVKFPQYRDTIRNVDLKLDKPKYLTYDEMWDGLEPAQKPSPSPVYDKIMHLFTTTDLKGYHRDERFANLIDDSLHCFYAAHCDYFITIDQRCYDKAKIVYDKLKIKTKVLKPNEFVDLYTNE
ncbi:MAG: hypothetical protein EOO20_11380 [Chryseobacterium sp.]|nr:MAG: hypothetical protein EOO20_11380 [Chryseobacterium sp.]